MEGPRAAELELLRLPNLHNLAPRLIDFGETRAAMGACDLIITVDTVIAHLAGSLRLPTYLLLPRWADFRWGLEGETTPWYPGMRLFRQEDQGDWTPVFHQLAGILRATTERRA